MYYYGGLFNGGLIMTYISQQNSTIQNLEALANLAHPMTKECADAIDAKNKQFFKTKEMACTVSAIGLVVLGLTTAALSLPVGAVVTSLVIIPVSLGFILKTQASEYDTVINFHSRVADDIARSITCFMNLKRAEKQLAILAVHGGTITGYNKGEVVNTVQKLSALWDNNGFDEKYQAHMQEHAQLRLLALKVISRSFYDNQPSFSDTRSACQAFLTGKNGEYLGVEHTRATGKYSACIV